jgi:hypothetical protein
MHGETVKFASIFYFSKNPTRFGSSRAILQAQVCYFYACA